MTRRFVFAALLIFVFSPVASYPRPAVADLSNFAMDVGQGDSTLILCPENHQGERVVILMNSGDNQAVNQFT